MQSGNNMPEDSEETRELDDAQKRRLRAVRRGYRAESVEIKDGGWQLEVRYMDGSVETLNSKLLKLKASELS